MMRFENHEIAFDVPEDWTDASMTEFRFPEAGTNLALSKRKADPAIPLSAYTTSLVLALRRSFEGLVLVDRRTVALGAAMGEQIIVEHAGPEGPLRNLVVLVIRDAELWSFAASAPLDKLDMTADVVPRVLRSFEVLP